MLIPIIRDMGLDGRNLDPEDAENTLLRATEILVKPKKTIRLEGSPPYNWRNIAIALTDPDFSEQKAQSGVNA